MALQNGFPGHTALASFADLRRDLEGTVVRSAAGVLRAGVFPDTLGPLVTGRTDMKVNIADFRAVQNRGGAIFLANVGVDSSVTLDAAPASNKRIDLVYVYQQSVTLGDAASTPVFGVVKGTASATPTVPPLPAGVSTAIPLATVEIPAGATTTLSAGVVFTQVYPYTAMAGGTVHVRNTVELAAWVPNVGATAFNAADGATYTRGASGWVSVSTDFTTWAGNTDVNARFGVTCPWGTVTSGVRAHAVLRGRDMPAPTTAEVLNLVATPIAFQVTGSTYFFRLRRDDTSAWMSGVQTLAVDVFWTRKIEVN